MAIVLDSIDKNSKTYNRTFAFVKNFFVSSVESKEEHNGVTIGVKFLMLIKAFDSFSSVKVSVSMSFFPWTALIIRATGQHIVTI